MPNIRRKIIFIVMLIFLALPFKASAYFGTLDDLSPKLLNVYLKWQLSMNEVDDLAKWDVLILDMQTQENSSDVIRSIRKKNPNIIILPRIPSEEFNSNKEDVGWGKSVRNRLFDKIEDAWLLRDRNGNRLSFWVGTTILNVTNGANLVNGKRWNTLLPEFVRDEIISTGLWDGVFYDNMWPSIAWFNNGNLDVNSNGNIMSTREIDNKWIEGNIEILKRTQQLIGRDYLVIGNSHAFDSFQPYLNGIMLENFPAPWENGGTWSGSMKSYTRDIAFKRPKLMMINANNNNKMQMNNYRKMRFSLGSALLGDGYFSFDYGDQNHGQLWWYDEYSVNLGKPISTPINILDRNNKTFKDGVWRRDFENGIVIVNSTAQNQNYVFSNEQFQKINGTQDRLINNGSRVNMVSMFGKDSIVLLGSPSVISGEKKEIKEKKIKKSEVIRGVGFNNGGFVRVFNQGGKQVKNGFFTYNGKYPAGAQIIISDIDNDNIEEELVNYRGIISIYRNGKLIKSFKPYNGKFKGSISIAIADLNGDATKEIITGAGKGGGPHVRVFDKDGRPLIAGFFAYTKNFRGGVNVSVVDLNGDGTKEIVTAAGSGGGPHIRVFTKDGRPLTSGFFAYDRNFRGGVSIAVGDVLGDNEKEIIVGAGAGGSPEVRIFTKDGNFISKFLAYDKNDYSGIIVMTANMAGDKKDEILVNSLGY